jgi:hypothetical protein
MRLTDDERHRRLCEAALEALTVSGGWLSLPQLRDGLGQGWVTPAELDDALAELLSRGLIVAKRRRRGVGRHGRPRTVVAARTVPVVVGVDQQENVTMPTLTPIDRLLLIEHARAQLEVAHADSAVSLEVEQSWLRICATLLAADEPASTNSDADPDPR